MRFLLNSFVAALLVVSVAGLSACSSGNTGQSQVREEERAPGGMPTSQEEFRVHRAHQVGSEVMNKRENYAPIQAADEAGDNAREVLREADRQ